MPLIPVPRTPAVQFSSCLHVEANKVPIFKAFDTYFPVILPVYIYQQQEPAPFSTPLSMCVVIFKTGKNVKSKLRAFPFYRGKIHFM